VVQQVINIRNMVNVSNDMPITIIAGLNVLESENLAFEVCEALQTWTRERGLNFIFKASWDKANRTSLASFRGPGLPTAQKIFRGLRETFGVPLVTDIHEPEQVHQLAPYVDVLQIPAFLSRQTDLLRAACGAGRPLLIKKMQMMSPTDALRIAEKCAAMGCEDVIVCERGTTFGYNNLVVDPLAFTTMSDSGVPVVFDVTHALQQPGGRGQTTDGRGAQTIPLAMAGISQGIGGLFFECHPSPEHALCDGPCAMALTDVPALLDRVAALDKLVKSWD
jgi:2-dehydro-3-deoxyphosphooctonate aldolase (KDO 8-P synthase)